MSRNTFVSKFLSSGENVFMKLDWIQNEQELFTLQVIHPGRDWSGTGSYTMQVVHHYSKKLYQTDSDYCVNARKCLTGEGPQDEYKFELSLNEVSDTALFIWKKRFGDIYELQGSLPLYKDEKQDYKAAFIDFLIDNNKDLKTTVMEMEQKAELVNVELENCKKTLEKFVNEKTTMEKLLYGKFVQLLNAKKQRIKLLENQLKTEL